MIKKAIATMLLATVMIGGGAVVQQPKNVEAATNYYATNENALRITNVNRDYSTPSYYGRIRVKAVVRATKSGYVDYKTGFFVTNLSTGEYLCPSMEYRVDKGSYYELVYYFWCGSGDTVQLDAWASSNRYINTYSYIQ